MKQKLCVIGEALIDFIPQRKGCDLKDVEGFSRVAGGAPANVAGAVAKLGVPAMVLTQLGKDAFGDHIIESLKESGIDTSHILQTSAYDTSLSFVSLREDGNRDFKFYRRTAADLQSGPENIHEHLLDDCGLVHFCSVSLVDSPMKQAHRALLELALKKGVLGFLETLDTVLTELCVERIVLAEEIKTVSPEMHQAILERFPGIPVDYVPHEEFKHQTERSKAVVRTGECTSYANIILVSGVTF